MIYSAMPHSQAAEYPVCVSTKQEQKRLTLVQRQLCWTHAVVGKVIF